MLLEHVLETTEGIRNEKEIRRREKRLSEAGSRLAGRDRPLPWVHYAVARVTVRSVKFIRWLRCLLHLAIPWEHAVARLREVYAVF